MKTKKNEKPTGETVQQSIMRTREFAEITVALIDPSPYQTRKRLTDIEALAESLQEQGVICPVTVRIAAWPASPGIHQDRYELIAGHRRVEAAKLIGLPTIPAIVINGCSDREAAELCVSENMQRTDLTPLEEAEGISALLGTGHTVQDVADRLGRSRKWVAKRANLLNLCDDIKARLANPDDPFTMMSIEGLELIASLPESIQLDMLKQFGTAAPTVSAIRAAAYAHMRDIDSAGDTFDSAPCPSCTKRTGAQPDLFASVEPGNLGCCLDAACFAQRRKFGIGHVVDELKGDCPTRVIVSASEEVRKASPEIDPLDKYVVCDEGVKGAVEVTEIRADGGYSTIHVIAPPRQKATKAKSKASKKPVAASADEKVVRFVVDRIKQAEAAHENPLKGIKAEDLVKLIVADSWADALATPYAKAVDSVWIRMAVRLVAKMEAGIENTDAAGQVANARDYARVLFNIKNVEAELN